MKKIIAFLLMAALGIALSLPLNHNNKAHSAADVVRSGIQIDRNLVR